MDVHFFLCQEGVYLFSICNWLLRIERVSAMPLILHIFLSVGLIAVVPALWPECEVWTKPFCPYTHTKLLLKCYEKNIREKEINRWTHKNKNGRVFSTRIVDLVKVLTCYSLCRSEKWWVIQWKMMAIVKVPFKALLINKV